MMLTMPGLPMLGHGQIEGFAEKYGMEYQRAYWNETPDQYLIERHEREIFPLAHKRYLFAGVEHFLLYDFFTTDGSVAEDVFAYSNRAGEERALVIYHNKYASVRGWVRMSAAFAVKTGAEERTLVQRSLGEGLGLRAGGDMFCIFRDHISGMEYIRPNDELIGQGLYTELDAYKCHVFLDFREVRDDPVHQYGHLAGFLAGRGVPSIDEALRELFLQPIHYPLKELVNADMFRRLLDAVATGDRQSEEVSEREGDELEELAALEDQPDEDLLDDAEVAGQPSHIDALQSDDGAVNVQTFEPSNLQPLLNEVEQKMLSLLREIKQFTESGGDEASIAHEVRDELAVILQLPALDRRLTGDQAGLAEVRAGLDGARVWGSLFGWAFVHALGKITGLADFAEQSRSWIDEWLLGRIIAGALRDLGLDEQQSAVAVTVVKRMTSHQSWFETPGLEHAYQLVEALLSDGEVQQLLRVNRYQDILWFDKRAFEQLLWWMLAVAVVSIGADSTRTPAEASEVIGEAHRTIVQLRDAAEASGYQVEKLLAMAHA
jgi:hypothetical protein